MGIRDPYQGERNESGQRDGRGSYQWLSGFSYKGGWRKGVMHGHGVMRAGNSKIEGEFTHGEINGMGVRTWLDGDNNTIQQYRGEFHQGEMSGHGEMVTVLERYVGSFVANRREGRGILWTAAKAVPDLTKSWKKEVPGDRVEGAWVDNKIHGPGKLVQLGGHAYTGEFAGGWRTGTGLGSWAGGATYKGEWLQDLRHGEGSYRCLQSGLEYHGPWVEDIPTACAKQLTINFTQPVIESKDGKRATPNKGKKKEESELLQFKPGDQLPPIVFKAGMLNESTSEKASIQGEDGEIVSLSLPVPTATGESGRKVLVSVRHIPASDEGDDTAGASEEDSETLGNLAYKCTRSNVEEFFVSRPTISELSSGQTRFLGNETVPLIKDVKSKKEEKMDFKGLFPSIILNDPQDRVESGWICQTMHATVTGKSTDELITGEPSKGTWTFPPEMGCTISFDFCLDAEFGALLQEGKEDDTVSKSDDAPVFFDGAQQGRGRITSVLRGRTQLLETFEIGFPLVISIACVDEPSREKDDIELNSKEGGEVGPFDHTVQGGLRLVNAVLVVHLPDSKRCHGATLEFSSPDFDPLVWHSIGVTLAPNMEMDENSWFCVTACDGLVLPARHQNSNSFSLRPRSNKGLPGGDRLWGVRCKLGGEKFAGAFANLVLSDAIMSNDQLAGLTACFKNYYIGEAKASIDQAKEIADFESRWLVKEGKDEDEPSKEETDLTIGRGSTTTDRKSTISRKSNTSRKSVLATVGNSAVSKLKEGAPDPPLHVPGATRVSKSTVTLKEGHALVSGIKLSSRTRPGKYVLDVHDVSHDGFKRWSKVESEVFPPLPDVGIEFTVV